MFYLEMLFKIVTDICNLFIAVLKTVENLGVSYVKHGSQYKLKMDNELRLLHFPYRPDTVSMSFKWHQIVQVLTVYYMPIKFIETVFVSFFSHNLFL